jgi:ribose transport system ATP-binding protein
VRDVAFDVRAGEIVGLAGLVGAGRTDIVRAIAGADVPTAGEIDVDGKARRGARSADAIAPASRSSRRIARRRGWCSG